VQKKNKTPCVFFPKIASGGFFQAFCPLFLIVQVNCWFRRILFPLRLLFFALVFFFPPTFVSKPFLMFRNHRLHRPNPSSPSPIPVLSCLFVPMAAFSPKDTFAPPPFSSSFSLITFQKCGCDFPCLLALFIFPNLWTFTFSFDCPSWPVSVNSFRRRVFCSPTILRVGLGFFFNQQFPPFPLGHSFFLLLFIRFAATV